jgi:hypothetical protein
VCRRFESVLRYQAKHLIDLLKMFKSLISSRAFYVAYVAIFFLVVSTSAIQCRRLHATYSRHTTVSFPDRPQLRAGSTLQLAQQAQFVAGMGCTAGLPFFALRTCSAGLRPRSTCDHSRSAISTGRKPCRKATRISVASRWPWRPNLAADSAFVSLLSEKRFGIFHAKQSCADSIGISRMFSEGPAICFCPSSSAT